MKVSACSTSIRTWQLLIIIATTFSVVFWYFQSRSWGVDTASDLLTKSYLSQILVSPIQKLKPLAASSLNGNCLSSDFVKRLAQPDCPLNYNSDPREAYVMLHTDDLYLEHLIALEMLLRDVMSTKKRVCLISSEVHATVRSILSDTLGMKLVHADEMKLEEYPNFTPETSRW